MISIGEAQAAILAECHLVGARRVPISEARGLVLAETVTAADDVPHFANSAMDGFALRSGDVRDPPSTLALVGNLAAGSQPQTTVGPHQAIRIMTGAPIPPGADAVVMVERTSMSDDDQVVVNTDCPEGTNIRTSGSDIRQGQAVLRAGAPINAGAIGVLASLGLTHVEAFRRPRVGVLSTGDELVDPALPLLIGQIRDSNRPTLLALVELAGFEAVDLGRVGDDLAAISAAIEFGVGRCHALITSGGVSVGDFDYTTEVLNRLGRMWWWQVAVKPAKPLAFGTVGGIPVFGLPGNPVSSMVSFELFAHPALRKMAGHHQLFRAVHPALADEDLLRRPDGKCHLVRVTLHADDDGRWRACPLADQGSHMLSAMARADALAFLVDGYGVHRGETVNVMPLGTLWT